MANEHQGQRPGIEWEAPSSWGYEVLLHRPALLGDVALPRVTEKFLDHLRGWNRARGRVRKRMLSDGQEQDRE